MSSVSSDVLYISPSQLFQQSSINAQCFYSQRVIVLNKQSLNADYNNCDYVFYYNWAALQQGLKNPTQ